MGTRVSTSAAPDFGRAPEVLPEAGAAEAGGKIRGRRQLQVRSHAHVVRVLIGSMPEPPQLAQIYSPNGPAPPVG